MSEAFPDEILHYPSENFPGFVSASLRGTSLFASWSVLFLPPSSPLLPVLLLFANTDQGLLDRDFFVIKTCLDRGIPVASVIGGGYDRDKRVLAGRHATVFRAAFQAWRGLGGSRSHWR